MRRFTFISYNGVTSYAHRCIKATDAIIGLLMKQCRSAFAGICLWPCFVLHTVCNYKINLLLHLSISVARKSEQFTHFVTVTSDNCIFIWPVYKGHVRNYYFFIYYQNESYNWLQRVRLNYMCGKAGYFSISMSYTPQKSHVINIFLLFSSQKIRP